jgi:uncharacterized membrane protein YkoI
MNMTQTIVATVGVVALGFGPFGVGYAASQVATHNPAHTSSIQVRDQGREEREEHHDEREEAAHLANRAKIDLTQATSAALAQVPGTALKAALENENGNLVYSVEVKTITNETKDVKVDAGNGKVLHVDVPDEHEGDEHD